MLNKNIYSLCTSPSLRCKLLTKIKIPSARVSKYFDEKAQIRSESEVGNQSESSLGYTNPEHAVVELSGKN